MKILFVFASQADLKIAIIQIGRRSVDIDFAVHFQFVLSFAHCLHCVKYAR